MAGSPSSISSDAAACIGTDADRGRPILRFLTCGSVDDGKSTLIGRLLYDTNVVARDTLAALERESRVHGTTGGDLDFALLVDGLSAEREQGITIDVAYRYFATPRRKFIVADTPGHVQYTRNMVTGASVSDLAVLLVDARKGLLEQTRRHTCVAHLLGIRHVVVAVNKMDLVGFDRGVFEAIARDYAAFAGQLGIAHVLAIPIAARDGDNLVKRSARMAWYEGPTLVRHLEEVDVEESRPEGPMRLPVQWVCRPDLDFRGYAGTLAGGSLKAGDEVVALPSGRTSRVTRLLAQGAEASTARTGDAVMVTLADEIDISRGDVLADPRHAPEAADQFQAHLLWMGQEPLLKGRPYLIRCGTQTSVGQISEIKYKLNVDNLDHIAARDLALNEIGVCNLSVSKPLVFDAYADNRDMGSFIVIDRTTNATVGAGMIQFALRRAQNIRWQAIDVRKEQRAALKGQRPVCLWFTGLSGSGKSTVANLLEKRLYDLGRHTYILDGDNVRHGLNRDLGFTDADRVENIRRVVEVARLMVDAGLVTLVSFISPFRAERQLARERFADGEFLELYMDTPIEVCERRDAKGLYAKARAGQLANFTGISSPYEPPTAPDLHLDGGEQSPEALVERILADLQRRGIV